MVDNSISSEENKNIPKAKNLTQWFSRRGVHIEYCPKCLLENVKWRDIKVSRLSKTKKGYKPVVYCSRCEKFTTMNIIVKEVDE